MDIEGNLKCMSRPRRQVENFAKLVNLKPIRLTPELHTAVRAAPIGNGRESPQLAGGNLRPFGQYHGRSCRAPRHSAGGNRAIGLSDVLADSEIPVVSGEPRATVSVRMPKLRVPWVDIDKHPVAKPIQ